MNRIKTMESNNINDIISYYENLRHDGYACTVYGSMFDLYIAEKLSIKIRTSEFHKMTSEWINYLWINDKNNILLTVNNFINNYKS